MRTLATLCLVLLGAAVAAAHGHHPGHPHQVSAAPDLLAKLGPEAVRAAAVWKGEVRPEDELYASTRGAKAAGEKVQGTGSSLVILVSWTDHPADTVAHPASDYQDLLFSTGVWPTGSLNDYYLENSYGAYGVQGSVHGWATASGLYADLTPTDYGEVQAVLAAVVAQLDPVIDYAQFDNDGPDGVPDSGDDDGLVDALFFVHAGAGREQTGDFSDIWSHAWAFSGGLPTADGVDCYRYSVEPEMLSDGTLVTMGVFAHEYGHVLGLPDLYDTDYSSSGIGSWGLMSGGSWNRRAGDAVGSAPAHLSAWSKVRLGWIEPINVSADMSGVVVPPVETHPVAYRLWRGGVVGDEYFLVENRRRLGFDEGLIRRQTDYGLPAPEGLLVTHVDDTRKDNADELRRLVDVVEASPWFHGPDDWFEHLDGERDHTLALKLNRFNRGDDGDLWPGYSLAASDTIVWAEPRDRDRLAGDTVPNTQGSDCDPTGVALENIAFSGQDVTVDFLVGVPAAPEPIASKVLVWSFEDDDDGWRYCRSRVHRDETRPGSCSGTGGLWFGIVDTDFGCGSGYGNDWNDFTWLTLTLAAGSTVTLRHRYDLEYDFDHAYVEVRCAGSHSSPWHTVAALNGSSECVTDTWVLPAEVFEECGPKDGVALVDLRLRLESDGAYSGEDGLFCGDGWWVDEVLITGEFVTDIAGVPSALVLAEPRPNPFNPATELRFHVPADARDVRLAVFDQRGRMVRRLEAEAGDGWRTARWDGRDAAGRELPGGVYFARLRADGEVRVRKLALLK